MYSNQKNKTVIANKTRTLHTFKNKINEIKISKLKGKKYITSIFKYFTFIYYYVLLKNRQDIVKKEHKCFS